MNNISIITGNFNKLKEFQKYFSVYLPMIHVINEDYDIPELQSLDDKEIITAKAQDAFRKFQKPIIIDDSGFYFTDYTQFPGTMSKFVYQALGFEGIFKLVKPGSKAYFSSSIAYIDRENEVHQFAGTLQGTVVALDPTIPVDEKFPYCSIFKLDGTDKPYEGLRHDPTFNYITHRRKAFIEFSTWYKENRL